MDNGKTLVLLLESIFGERKSGRSNTEIEFNCPYCDDGQRKFNLSVNISKRVFHCWSCAYRGSLYYLLKNNTVPASVNIDELLEIRTEHRKHSSEPTWLYGFRPLTMQWDSIHYYAAMDYLKSRGISKKLIEKHNIGYTEKGKYRFRIVLLNTNNDGKVDFFCTRSFYDSVKPKYMNPAVDRTNVIFGERHLNWEKPIVIVEGPFDHIVTPNSVPLLGSSTSTKDRFVRQCMHYKPELVVCLDNDAVGVRSSIKLAKLLFNLGLPVSLVQYPYKQKDMADIYSIHGAIGVHNTVENRTEIKSNLDLLRLEV